MKKILALALVLMASSPTFAFQDPPVWEKFTSDKGRFSVLLPGKPKEETKTADSPHGPYTTTIFLLSAPGAIYIAGWVDYDPNFKFGVQAELEANRDNFVKAMKATVLQTRQIEYGTHPGIEFTAESEAHFVSSRVYVVGRRPYQLIAVVPKSDRDSPDIDRFLTSFAVTP
ncbi:MAG TPA: hypothetical protein VFX96_01210 [Pyrinomonadaceae bacterium]|nr:hypothetical protein [Pyrinomonadaceae bacterium]